jgi:cholesterol transport system auxiliary component
MMRLEVIALAVALAACVGPGGKGASVAHYDLGPAERNEARAPSFLLRNVDVHAPSWLDASALQYRLAYADAARRHSYAESRWVAPPGELIEQTLRRAIVSSESDQMAAGCRLRVDLDEFVHLFESPAASRGVIEVRVSLQAPRTDALLARRSFSIAKQAASQDARGGVAALSAATRELIGSMYTWLGSLGKEGSAASNVAERCRGA